MTPLLVPHVWDCDLPPKAQSTGKSTQTVAAEGWEMESYGQGEDIYGWYLKRDGDLLK